MEKKKIKIFAGKKKWFWIAGILLVVAAAAASLYFLGNREENMPDKMMEMPGGVSFSEDVITASGLTQVGMAAQEWEQDFLTEGLTVEETYLHVGDVVEADTPIFKVTQESLEIAQKELELAEKEASLNLREGLITYETGKIDAQKEYDLALVEAEYAKNTYDSEIQSAQESLDSVQEQVEEAQQKVDEYTASIETNYYYTYYEVKEKQELWYEYASLVIELYDKWNVEYLEDMYGGMGGSMGGSSESFSGSEASGSSQQSSAGSAFMLVNVSSDDESKYEVYQMLEEETALRKQEYEEALELYEDAKATAAAGIEQAKSELAVLEAKLVKQQDAFEKAKLAAQAVYDQALAAKDSAQMVYDSTMEQLEEDYETLKDKQEEAAENLALLMDSVGDGYFYTQEAGTVMMNNVKAADVLTQSTIVLAYQDTSDITVSASVEQADIASISIGQEVVIYVSGYETMDGVVTAIDPVSGSSRGSSVSYTVTAAPNEAADGLEGNMTAYVYFGLTDEEKEMLMTGFGGTR